jgi:hypothetical protein
MECQRVETQIIMQVWRLIGKKLAREKKIKTICMKRKPTTPQKN